MSENRLHSVNRYIEKGEITLKQPKRPKYNTRHENPEEERHTKPKQQQEPKKNKLNKPKQTIAHTIINMQI